jgi:predicted transcriptional regulator
MHEMTSLPSGIDNDLELDILEHIHTSAGEVRQRDLATVIGKSLGMTNAILHRLTEKGLLMVSKVNNRNISYIVTPHGVRQLAGRSYRYFKRTIKNVVDFKEAIERELCSRLQNLAQSLPADQARVLLLVGPSDLDFILEHLAHKYHLVWQPVAGLEMVEPLPPGAIIVWSEAYEIGEVSITKAPGIILRALVG